MNVLCWGGPKHQCIENIDPTIHQVYYFAVDNPRKYTLVDPSELINNTFQTVRYDVMPIDIYESELTWLLIYPENQERLIDLFISMLGYIIFMAYPYDLVNMDYEKKRAGRIEHLNVGG